MPSFGSILEIENYIKKSVDRASNEVGKFIVEDTKEEIDKVVYNAGDPQFYNRTYTLRESMTYNKEMQNGELVLTILNDYINNANLSYYSVVDGSPIGSDIIEIITQGKAGRIFGEGFWTEKRDFIESEINKLKRTKEYKKILKEELYKEGIIVIG